MCKSINYPDLFRLEIFLSSYNKILAAAIKYIQFPPGLYKLRQYHIQNQQMRDQNKHLTRWLRVAISAASAASGLIWFMCSVLSAATEDAGFVLRLERGRRQFQLVY
jgi:hypothetical protein